MKREREGETERREMGEEIEEREGEREERKNRK